MALNYRFICDWDTIYSDDFQKNWHQWFENSIDNQVFMHPDLCVAWLETYRPIRNISPLFCLATEGESTILLPLVIWKKNWKNAFQRIAVPVGYSDFDYHDPLVCNVTTDQLKSFFNEVTGYVRNFTKVDRIEINGIRFLIKSEGWQEESDFCPYALLDKFQNMTEFLLSLKGSLRGDLNRQQRKMEEIGKLTIKTYDQDNLQDAIHILPQYLKLHSLRWPASYKAPMLHQHILEYGIRAKIVDFTELKINETSISWHLGFTDKKTFYYYMPVINPEYSNFSPGKVHLLFLVEKCLKGGIRKFDHLRGDENYKTGWTDAIQVLYKYQYNSTRLPGKLRNFWIDKGKKLLDR